MKGLPWRDQLRFKTVSKSGVGDQTCHWIQTPFYPRSGRAVIPAVDKYWKGQLQSVYSLDDQSQRSAAAC